MIMLTTIDPIDSVQTNATPIAGAACGSISAA
jgi:hypothetical protein